MFCFFFVACLFSIAEDNAFSNDGEIGTSPELLGSSCLSFSKVSSLVISGSFFENGAIVGFPSVFSVSTVTSIEDSGSKGISSFSGSSTG